MLIKQEQQNSLIFVNKFQPNVCSRCHDLLMMSMSITDITILNIKSSDYRCIISRISKSEATNSMENTGLTKKIIAL